MRLGTRVWSVGKFFLLVGALGATFLVFFGISMRVALRAREVEVPVLVGLTVNEATADARRRSGSACASTRIAAPIAKVPLGRVMQQDPAAGVQARRQRTIRVWVSSGPRVDDRARPGRADRAHRAHSPRAGRRRRSASLSEIPIARLSRRRRRGAGPAARRRARREVSLLVNRGEQATTYVMPDVIGMDGDRAAEALRSRGFRVTIVGSQPYPGMPAGHGRPAAAGRRIPGGRGRSDLPRGEPMSGASSAAVQIAPSILSADFAALGRDIAAVERGGADLIHVDVMDGHFVPNITIGPPVVRAIKRIATRPLDVHLMIEEPDRYIDDFVAAGASMVSVHVEAVPHLHRTVTLHQEARRQGGRRAQPVDAGSDARRHRRRRRLRAGDVGQPGLRRPVVHPAQLEKLRRVRAVLTAAGSSAPIEIDGGIDAAQRRRGRRRRRHHPRRRQAIFGTADPEGATRALRAAANRTPSGSAHERRRRRARVRRTRVRVRYADTDQMGVVYYANYLVWFEVGRTEWLRDGGWSYREMEEDGVALPVIEAHCEYRQPARYDDEIEIRTRATRADAGPDPLRLRGRGGRRHALGHRPHRSCGPRTRRPPVPAAGRVREILAIDPGRWPA